MKFSEERLRSVLEQSLDHFEDKADEDYDWGNPAEAARNLREKVDQFIEDIEGDLDNAGEFLRPGLKKATFNYLKRKFKSEA